MLFNNFVPMQPWRTQVHVLSITPAEHVMDVEVPGWHENDVFQVDTRNVPAAVMNRLWEGDHLYAYVNIGAERTEDLKFRDWHLAEPHEKLNGR